MRIKCTDEEYRIYRKVLACDVQTDMIDYFDRLRGTEPDEYVEEKIEWVESMDVDEVLDYYETYLRGAYWDGEQFDVCMDYMLEEL